MNGFLRCLFLGAFFSVFVSLSACTENPTPAPVVNAWYQPNAASKYYVVQSDDTIYSIAFAFGLDYRQLAAENNLSPPYRIEPGQRLLMTHQPPQFQQNLPTPQTETVPLPASLPTTPRRTPTTEPTPTSVPVVVTEPKRQSPELIPNAVFRADWHWPIKGRLIHPFSRNPGGRPGIAIGGKLGSLVRSTAAGTVVYSGDGIRGYGNLIIVKHNDSYLSAYAFNQRNLVHVGERVRSGQVIARMGQDDAGHTMLYFEIRRNGVPVNPMRFLKTRIY